MFVFVWGYVHCVPMEDRDPWELELQAVLSCPMWESNSGPLEKQDMLLITEPVCHHLKLSWEHLIIKCWFFFQLSKKNSLLSMVLYTGKNIQCGTCTCRHGLGCLLSLQGWPARNGMKRIFLKGIYSAKENSALSPWQGLIHNLRTNYKSSECIR